MGRTIAITNQKGGVGKTTTAVNLSACIGLMNKRVLVIDIDPQGNSTSGYGIDKKSIKYSSYDVLLGLCECSQAIVKTKWENVDIMPSNINLAGADIELVDLENREKRLMYATKELEIEYDYIFIDCPPSLGLITLNGLVAAGSTIIPIQCEYYALEGLAQLINTLSRVKKAYNPRLHIEGVLLTMFDGRLNLSMQVVDEIKKYFADKIYKTAIPRNVRLSEAPSFGMPVIYYDKHSKGAIAYSAFAEEFMNRK